ncbi:MAG: hypothetical protein BGO55_11555 [Sphingobacteriales bacterium 50-39]|nr:hypothetical protein [Sphingobacteriales bacterium]OJW54327.1 MAG: hypothetical protein BGO55_11555 [Sphingobacteriales bacterium 50-39]
MVIRIVRPSWSREMEVKTWMKGTAYAMILIKSPARDKGTSFLKKRKEPVLDGYGFYQRRPG